MNEKIVFICDSIDNYNFNIQEFSGFINFIHKKDLITSNIDIIYPSSISLDKLSLDKKIRISEIFEIGFSSEKYITINSYCKKLNEIIQKIKPMRIFILSSLAGRSIASWLAAKFNTGSIADVVDVVKDNQYNDNHYVYLRSTNNDSFLSKIKVKEFPEIITFRSLGKNSLNYESQKINCIVKYILPDDKRIEVGSINCITNKSQHSLVIGIGRGVNKETINKLCMLSKEYNIKVVCTKPLVENKTFLFENQVGQSGFTICPDVYLALGISGSIQHLLGIKNCKKIIAVNTDELANIHSVANFSIIQDCNIFVDKLIEYIEKRKQLKGV